VPAARCCFTQRFRGGRPSSRREIIANVEGAELFLYPGDRHLFADNSVSDYEPESAALLKQRALSFLERVE
jgi:dienelactone hydrolase